MKATGANTVVGASDELIPSRNMELGVSPKQSDQVSTYTMFSVQQRNISVGKVCRVVSFTVTVPRSLNPTTPDGGAFA